MTSAELIHWFDSLTALGKVTTAAITAFGIIITPLIPTLRALWKARNHMAVTTSAMQDFLARQMLDRAASMDPSEYWTLDMVLESGDSFKPPMFPGAPMEIGQNLTIAVSAHTKEITIATLQCKGIGVLPVHMHRDTHESVRVESGAMTEMATGKIHRAGDVWNIPAGEMHGAYFHDCIATISYRPTLKTAKEQPIDLEAMKIIPRHVV